MYLENKDIRITSKTRIRSIVIYFIILLCVLNCNSEGSISEYLWYHLHFVLGMDRKAELARKKAKLAALREERLRKEEQQNKIPPPVIAAPVDPVSVEGILKELGVTDEVVINGNVDHEEQKKSADTVALNSKYYS